MGAPISLRLFIAGKTQVSQQAVHYVRRICEGTLAGRHRLTVVDVAENPEAARSEHVFVTPALIKDGPGRRRHVVGDFSDELNLLAVLRVGEDET